METEAAKTPKTRAAKPRANADKPQAKSSAKPKQAKPKPASKAEEIKKFEKDDLIPCSSVFAGTCILIGKRTGTQYVWEAMGEEQEVFYQDLQAEVLNKRSPYIYNPLIIIEDPDVYRGKKDIEKLYATNIYTVDEIQRLMNSNNTGEIKRKLRGMPEGILASVKSVIATLIQDGEITSYRAVKAVDDELGTDIAKQFELYN